MRYEPVTKVCVSVCLYAASSGPSERPRSDSATLLTAQAPNSGFCVMARPAPMGPASALAVEPYALRAAVDHVIDFLPNNGQGQIIAVFSIGQTMTSLTVVLNRQTIFEREQTFGGQQLTQDLVRLYGLTPEEAEIKKRVGDLPDNYQRDLLQPFVEQAATDIGRALQFFFTSTPYTRVDQIYLAGGSSVVPGLAEAVAQRTQVPAEILSPFQGMELAGTIRERQLRADAQIGRASCRERV